MSSYRRGIIHGVLAMILLAAGGLVWGYLQERSATDRLLSERAARELAESIRATLAEKLTEAQQREIELEEALEREISLTGHWRARAERIPATVYVDREVEVAVPGATETVYVGNECAISDSTLGWECDGEELLIGGRVAFRLRGRSWADFRVDGEPVRFESGWQDGEVLEAFVEDPTPEPPGRKYSRRWLAGVGFGDNAQIGLFGTQIERKRWGLGVLAGIERENGATDPVIMALVSRRTRR